MYSVAYLSLILLLIYINCESYLFFCLFNGRRNALHTDPSVRLSVRPSVTLLGAIPCRGSKYFSLFGHVGKISALWWPHKISAISGFRPLYEILITELIQYVVYTLVRFLAVLPQLWLKVAALGGGFWPLSLTMISQFTSYVVYTPVRSALKISWFFGQISASWWRKNGGNLWFPIWRLFLSDFYKIYRSFFVKSDAGGCTLPCPLLAFDG